jgi:hypothetical protein
MRKGERIAYGDADEDTNSNTGRDRQSSLSVVLRGKEFRVLQCSVGLVVSVKRRMALGSKFDMTVCYPRVWM